MTRPCQAPARCGPTSLRLVSATRTMLLGAALGLVACASKPPADAATPVPLCARGPAPTAFELRVLGSGGPSSSGRAAAAYVVSFDGTPRLLVDAGPGAFLRLGEMGIDLERLDTILLTHLHIDHAGDVPGFLKSRDLSYDHPLTFRFYGPEEGGVYPGTRAFIETLFGAKGAFAYVTSFRNTLTLESHELPSRAEAPIQEVFREGEVVVTSIAVDHDDAPAVAYRIEHGGHALVMSGDLASKNDNLVRLAHDADLLVYDTSVRDPPASPPSLYTLHTTPARIGQVAAAAHVRALLLSHLPASVEVAEEEVLRSNPAELRRAGALRGGLPARRPLGNSRARVGVAGTGPPDQSFAFDSPVSRKSRSGSLQVCGGRHAACRADADDRAASTAARQLEQGRAEVADARHSVGMAERDRAAVDVGRLPRSL